MIGNDLDLLHEFVRTHSQDAFAALVQRHVNLVYSAALRQVGTPHLADDVAQCVFADLARNAHRLKSNTILTAWLYQVTRRTAIDVVRREAGRQSRERAAMEMAEMNADAAEWRHIQPFLDEAMQSLDETDRTAVLLRYFENKSLREVGQALGTSEDAAQKRVSRAVDRLREFFGKRGVTVGASALVLAVSAHSIQAAPAPLAGAVTATAFAEATAGASSWAFIEGALKFMAWTKTKTAIAIGLGVLLTGGITATVAWKKWEAYKSARDSWRAIPLQASKVETTMPQVRILPTKFSPPAGNIAQTTDNRWGGIGVGVREIVFAAYNWRPARIVFPNGEPPEKYDFIANLPQGSLEALKEKLKDELGITVRPEIREMDVLVLSVQRPDAPGLMPPIAGGNADWSGMGRYYCEDQPLSKATPPHAGLTRFLEFRFQMPVIDKTGLTQHFRIDLRWNPRNQEPTQAIRRSLLNQLGLELLPARAPVEVLVVEKKA
jgi:uncharacterized protein (TIGR03435 family)